MTVTMVPLDIASEDQDHVHKLLRRVDEEEARQHKDLRDGQAGVREGSVLQGLLEHLIDIWQHVSKAAGHNHAPTEAHHAGQDGAQP